MVRSVCIKSCNVFARLSTPNYTKFRATKEVLHLRLSIVKSVRNWIRYESTFIWEAKKIDSWMNSTNSNQSKIKWDPLRVPRIKGIKRWFIFLPNI